MSIEQAIAAAIVFKMTCQQRAGVKDPGDARSCKELLAQSGLEHRQHSLLIQAAEVIDDFLLAHQVQA